VVIPNEMTDGVDKEKLSVNLNTNGKVLLGPDPECRIIKFSGAFASFCGGKILLLRGRPDFRLPQMRGYKNRLLRFSNRLRSLGFRTPNGGSFSSSRLETGILDLV
jgi:hypothetical protein